MAVKVSSTLGFNSNSGHLLLLADSTSRRILALMEIFQMDALRTGAAMEDVALASRLYQLAIERAVGVQVPLARALDFVLRIEHIAPHAPGEIIETFRGRGPYSVRFADDGRRLGLDAET